MVMFKARVLLGALALVGATVAYAEVIVTPAVVSDFEFRGISQSATDPAVQVGVDYSAGPLHVGAWASNIDWGPSYNGNVELDLLADFTLGSDATAKFNFGLIDYTYPGMSSENAVEYWGMVSKGWLSARASYAAQRFGLTNAWYLETNASIPLGESGWEVALHAGHNTGSALERVEYTDWALGLSRSVGHFTLALKYVGSNKLELTESQSLALYGKRNVFDTRDRIILSVSTSLPWASP
jgi:uncharacterized protein (TIGR02001 family)